VDGVRAGRARAIASDLKNRCLAGKARVLYERGQHDEADIAYDQIDKSSIVWTDVLFEQAWNAFAKQEYNRALGKLVSYKSPLLKFVFNTETDVLRAQSYLALCLYDDANDAINEFNRRYSGIGQEVKRFVEQNDENLAAFFERGKRALRGPLQTEQTFDQILNRFVRSPYFRNLAQADSDVETELQQVDRFNVNQPGVTKNRGEGFAGFLRQVLSWRRKTARLLGGAFVKNALMDYHGALISDFEKMAFIKLEMLSRFKEKLMYPNRASRGRERGAREPSRRDDQMRWSFNGEFWTDELGDYVFGLESECGK
jgi:tetratricopeptide (TPR) repeat protein